MTSYPENVIPRAKIPCLLTHGEIVSLGHDNLVALRESAEYCRDHALSLFEGGAFGNRFTFQHNGQYYAMDESEATGMIIAESEAQIELFDNALRVAEDGVPYLPEFRPEDWFKPNVEVAYCYYNRECEMSRSVVYNVEPPLVDVEGMGRNRPRYHAGSPLIMRGWERLFFYNTPDFAVTWLRVIEALTPSIRSDRRNYNLLAALLGPTGLKNP